MARGEDRRHGVQRGAARVEQRVHPRLCVLRLLLCCAQRALHQLKGLTLTIEVAPHSVEASGAPYGAEYSGRCVALADRHQRRIMLSDDWLPAGCRADRTGEHVILCGCWRAEGAHHIDPLVDFG